MHGQLPGRGSFSCLQSVTGVMEFQLFTVSYRGEGVSAVYGQLTRIYVSYLVFARVPGELP